MLAVRPFDVLAARQLEPVNLGRKRLPWSLGNTLINDSFHLSRADTLPKLVPQCSRQRSCYWGHEIRCALGPPIATTSGEMAGPSGSNQVSTSGPQGTLETTATQSLLGSNMSARLQQLSMEGAHAGPRPGIWMDPACLPPPPMLQAQMGNSLLPTPRDG